MKKSSGWLWGCILVVLGVIFGLNALNITDINIFFPGWWTLIIIVPCAIGLLTEEHKGGDLVGLIFGICLLLACLNILPFGMLWKLLFPAILVILGIYIIMHGTRNHTVRVKIQNIEEKQHKKHAHDNIAEAEVVEDGTKAKTNESSEDNKDSKKKTSQEKVAEESGDFQEYWSTFGDQDIHYDDKPFTGCRVDVVFGGANLDLRKAKINNESIVRASSVFGGIVIYVPEDIKVEVISTVIIGGVSDNRRAKDSASGQNKTLYIDATCVFGGVEIR